MKVLVILGLLFACAQASSDLLKKALETIPVCAEELGLDLDKLNEILKESPLPEDDSELINFFSCYYDKVGTVKEDGELDMDIVETILPQWIERKYGDAVDADKVSKAALESCKDTPKGDSRAQTGIRYSNCVSEYLKANVK